jgi:hypothetical protein
VTWCSRHWAWDRCDESPELGWAAAAAAAAAASGLACSFTAPVELLFVQGAPELWAEVPVIILIRQPACSAHAHSMSLRLLCCCDGCGV